MKKLVLTSVLAALVCISANASDGGVYYETETVTKNVSMNIDTTTYNDNAYVAPRRVVVAQPRPCARATVAAPVRVKTYTEVIDHYQVYQPVTVYQPVGTYAQRRVVESARPCGCGK